MGGHNRYDRWEDGHRCVINKDSVGEVLESLQAPTDNIIDLVLVESIVASRAAVFSRELRLQKVELKENALQVRIA